MCRYPPHGPDYGPLMCHVMYQMRLKCVDYPSPWSPGPASQITIHVYSIELFPVVNKLCYFIFKELCLCMSLSGSHDKSPGGSKCFPLMNDGDHCALWDFKCAEIFCTRPQTCALIHSCLQLCPWTWCVFCTANDGILYRQVCVPFQIISNQLNLPNML